MQANTHRIAENGSADSLQIVPKRESGIRITLRHLNENLRTKSAIKDKLLEKSNLAVVIANRRWSTIQRFPCLN